jgi:hypothetical protein
MALLLDFLSGLFDLTGGGKIREMANETFP